MIEIHFAVDRLKALLPLPDIETKSSKLD